MALLEVEMIDEIRKVTDQYTESERRRLMKAHQLANIIDRELQDQVLEQTGCEYHPMDECGVAGADMNIVVTQLAYKILEKFKDV